MRASVPQPAVMKATWHISLPALGPYSEEVHFRPLLWMLKGMIAVNVEIMRWAWQRAAMGLSPPIPPLYASGVRYEEDKGGREDWRDCLAILSRGRGDCDNLVGYRCAELVVAGIPAEPVIKWQHIPREVAIRIKRPDGELAYPPKMVPDEGLWMVHCSVRHPNGFIEDVSKNLGMGGNYTSGV